MKLTPTPLSGAYLVDLERKGDERGFFARQFCQKEFQEAGLVDQFVQVSTSFNRARGTLRGMHYQLPPAAETKLIRCVRGAVWDCVIDLRTDSQTFLQSYGTKLSADNLRLMYVPSGFAHGFISLEANSELLYMIDSFYVPDLQRGVRWDDPRFAIEWPLAPQVISDRDRSFVDFNPRVHLDSEALS